MHHLQKTIRGLRRGNIKSRLRRERSQVRQAAMLFHIPHHSDDFARAAFHPDMAAQGPMPGEVAPGEGFAAAAILMLDGFRSSVRMKM